MKLYHTLYSKIPEIVAAPLLVCNHPNSYYLYVEDVPCGQSYYVSHNRNMNDFSNVFLDDELINICTKYLGIRHLLTHCSLETPKRVIGKSCRPR